jgi:hypothetical protein
MKFIKTFNISAPVSQKTHTNQSVKRVRKRIAYSENHAKAYVDKMLNVEIGGTLVHSNCCTRNI